METFNSYDTQTLFTNCTIVFEEAYNPTLELFQFFILYLD